MVIDIIDQFKEDGDVLKLYQSIIKGMGDLRSNFNLEENFVKKVDFYKLKRLLIDVPIL